MASFTKAQNRLRLPTLNPEFFLVSVWLGGLLAGTIYAASASTQYFLLMRMAPQSHVSIVGLATAVLLPFLITAFAVYRDRPWVLYPICFAKVFVFASCGFGITAAYGTAAWLIRFLLQFSDICSVPILCWFAMGHVAGRKKSWKRDIRICLMLDIAIICLDLWYISPFLALITKN